MTTGAWGLSEGVNFYGHNTHTHKSRVSPGNIKNEEKQPKGRDPAATEVPTPARKEKSLSKKHETGQRAERPACRTSNTTEEVR